ATAPAPPAKPDIRVEVRFSVKEFDPKNPGKAILECLVHNGTNRPIKVPAGYAHGFDSDIVIFGRTAQGFGWDMRLIRRVRQRKAPPPLAVVRAGKAMVVLGEGLEELLSEGRGVGWTWEA